MASSLFGVALAVAGGGPEPLGRRHHSTTASRTRWVHMDFPLLPLFGYCRNASCVDEAHGQQGGRNRRDRLLHGRAGAARRAARPAVSYRRVHLCDDGRRPGRSGRALQVCNAMEHALVLRGCAWEMPAGVAGPTRAIFVPQQNRHSLRCSVCHQILEVIRAILTHSTRRCCGHVVAVSSWQWLFDFAGSRGRGAVGHPAVNAPPCTTIRSITFMWWLTHGFRLVSPACGDHVHCSLVRLPGRWQLWL